MKTKYMVGALVVAMVCVVALVAVSGDGSDDPARDFTDREVVVFSDDKFIRDVRGILAASTGRIDSYILRIPSEGDMVIIDYAWFNATGETRPSDEQIHDLIADNVPVIFINSPFYVYNDPSLDIRTYISIADGDLAGGIYLDADGITHMFNFVGNDLEDALVSAYYWADEFLPQDRNGA